MGVAAHPLGKVPHDGKAAVVRLAGLGAALAGVAGSVVLHAGAVGHGAAVRKDAQVGMAGLAQGEHLAGSLHRHQVVQHSFRFAGLMLGGVGVPAVHGPQRVVVQIPHSGAVGGERIAHTGQCGNDGRQAGQRAAGGGHDDHSVGGGTGQRLPGARGHLAVAAQQGAVQVQGGKAYRGKRLRHKNSFYQQGTPAFWAGVQKNRILSLFYNTGRVCASGRNVL